MRGLTKKYKLPSFYEEDIRVELIHRRKIIRFVTFYLYSPKGTKETGVMRTDIVDPLRRVRKRYGFSWLFMQKQKLKYYYRLYLERYFKKIIKKLRRKHWQRCSLAFKFLAAVESRLDLLFFKSNFLNTPTSSRKFIRKGLVQLNNKRIKKISYQLKYFDIFYPIFKAQKRLKRLIIRRIRRNLFFHKYPLYLETNYKILHSLFLTITQKARVFLPFKRKQREFRKRFLSRWGNPYKKRVINTPFSSVYVKHYFIQRWS